MSISFLAIVLAIGGLAGLVVVIALVLLFRKGNQVDLTSPTDTKPEWMRQTPPAETIAATLADEEGVQVFDHDPGEKLAAPFAEQIEDIVQARLSKHPELSKYNVDFGSAPDGGLEIHVNGQVFTELDDLPDESLKALIREAVETWRKTH